MKYLKTQITNHLQTWKNNYRKRFISKRSRFIPHQKPSELQNQLFNS
jgi:hypothetical protein